MGDKTFIPTPPPHHPDNSKPAHQHFHDAFNLDRGAGPFHFGKGNGEVTQRELGAALSANPMVKFSRSEIRDIIKDLPAKMSISNAENVFVREVQNRQFANEATKKAADQELAMNDPRNPLTSPDSHRSLLPVLPAQGESTNHYMNRLSNALYDADKGVGLLSMHDNKLIPSELRREIAKIQGVAHLSKEQNDAINLNTPSEGLDIQKTLASVRHDLENFQHKSSAPSVSPPTLGGPISYASTTPEKPGR